MKPHPLPVLAGFFGAALHAQVCPNFGSQRVPASWTAAPVSLPCPGVSTWPAWRLRTPRHRAPTPHAGYRPLVARERPALLFQYACTGLVFAPVVLIRVRAMGYVVDMPEVSCR
jgi:hypothetical protein